MAHGLWIKALGLGGARTRDRTRRSASLSWLLDQNEIGEGFGDDVCVTSIDDGVL